MRAFPQELLIWRLKNRVPRGLRFDWLRNKSVEETLKELRELAGQDLGTDPTTWAEWWRKEKKRMNIEDASS